MLENKRGARSQEKTIISRKRNSRADRNRWSKPKYHSYDTFGEKKNINVCRSTLRNFL